MFKTRTMTAVLLYWVNRGSVLLGMRIIPPSMLLLCRCLGCDVWVKQIDWKICCLNIRPEMLTTTSLKWFCDLLVDMLRGQSSTRGLQLCVNCVWYLRSRSRRTKITRRGKNPWCSKLIIKVTCSGQ